MYTHIECVLHNASRVSSSCMLNRLLLINESTLLNVSIFLLKIQFKYFLNACRENLIEVKQIENSFESIKGCNWVIWRVIKIKQLFTRLKLLVNSIHHKISHFYSFKSSKIFYSWKNEFRSKLLPHQLRAREESHVWNVFVWQRTSLRRKRRGKKFPFRLSLSSFINYRLLAVSNCCKMRQTWRKWKMYLNNDFD